MTKSITTGTRKFGTTFIESLESNDEKTQSNNEILIKRINSNVIRASIVKVLADPLNFEIESQFSLTLIDTKRFMVNPHNLNNDIKKGKCLKIFDSGGIVKTYNLNDPFLNYFLSKTTLENDGFPDEDIEKVCTRMWAMTLILMIKSQIDNK